MCLVRRASPSELLIRWAIEPSPWDLEFIRYEIFRSQSPEGPWDQIGEAEEGAYHYIDRDVISPGISRVFYYIIRAADTRGGGFRDSKPALLEHDADNIALEMIRKKLVFLRVRGGVATAILLRKSWGAHCPNCWDPIRGLSINPGCPSCFGTGYSGGYLNPVFVPALMNPPPEVIEKTIADYKNGTEYCEIGPVPLVQKDDILVDRTMNLRYRIESVTRTSHRKHLVSQVLTLVALNENSVVYNIEVPEPSAATRGESFMGAAEGAKNAHG
jgi:hypothetical protein